MVDMSLLDPLVFGPSVLKPNFDLRLAEAECCGQFGAPRTGDVLGRLEFQLETERLLLGESGPLTSLAQTLPLSPRH